MVRIFDCDELLQPLLTVAEYAARPVLFVGGLGCVLAGTLSVLWAAWIHDNTPRWIVPYRWGVPIVFYATAYMLFAYAILS